MSLQLPRLPNRDELVSQVRRAWELCDGKKPAEALEVIRGVEAACAAAKVESSHVLFVAAVAADQSGKVLEALRYILKSLSLDVCSPPARHSLGIIVDRCRKKLVAGTMDADEGFALYETLASNGLADDACRLSYAQHLLDYEKPSEALAVAQAVALLNPNMADAWRLVGEAADALGNKELASEASGHCRAANAGNAWDSVPRGAWGEA